MSEPDIESYVFSILPHFTDLFLELASQKTNSEIIGIEFLKTNTYSKRGSEVLLLISEIDFIASNLSKRVFKLKQSLAIKFAKDTNTALTEMKNSLLLESKYFGTPEFGTPKVLTASTSQPIFLVYEGINGINYDECETILDKAFWAGRLLGILHGKQLAPVDDTLYKNYMRKLTQLLENTKYEESLSKRLSLAFTQLKGADSGSTIHSDFHQSNVMFTVVENNTKVSKVYVIDPEFMEVGYFDRMEDVGVFFGKQFFKEYTTSRTIENSIHDFQEFMRGYNSFLAENADENTIFKIYSQGVPIQFQLVLWALADALFLIKNQEGDEINVTHPKILSRMEFSLFILDHKELERVSLLNFLKNR